MMANVSTPQEKPMADPLWVPILTHYQADAPSRLDAECAADHIAQIAPHVRQLLIAGTTGDGWSMPQALLADWLDLLRSEDMPRGQKLMLGVLEPNTEAVVARARWIEGQIGKRPLSGEVVALTICPPVDPAATQERILSHFERVMEATELPLAVYQLPQVTGCTLSAESFDKLVESGRIAFFKDTSGTDAVISESLRASEVTMLRGAEGDYARWIAPEGPYDGWLLSTANGLAPELRQIERAVRQGDRQRAQALSGTLTEVVESLFEIASRWPSENTFALANRGVDVIRRGGAAKHLSGTGSPIDQDLLKETRVLLRSKLMPH
ncbi:dihydrodipicolinate synthase family protein [Leisingera sp.]|uniref:dihydrodipicolinate synthase family protein n=1 Tax=Leisingera sp. TaxID=1879318 RepID=UPI003A9024D3